MTRNLLKSLLIKKLRDEFHYDLDQLEASQASQP